MELASAREKLDEIIAHAPEHDDDSISHTESCTRLQLIDPILHEVLGWPREETRTEQNAGEGRLDYLLFDREGVCWFVVEAKRVQIDLLDRSVRRERVQQLKLSGSVLDHAAWPIIKDQMPAYLGRFNPNFALLTNGEQWVGFLSRLRPGAQRLQEAEGLVFRNYRALQNDFETFYEAFAYERVRHRHLVTRLAPARARGSIECARPRRVIPRGQEDMLSYQDREGFYADLREAMRIAFKPILDNPDALAACFVESEESQRAEERLERMANELQAHLRGVGDYQEDVRGALESPRYVDEQQRPLSAETLRGRGVLSRLLGEPSAGKSVFLKRFYTQRLEQHRDSFLLVWLDGQKLYPFDAARASKEALAQAERALFGEEGPMRSQYEELYRREWSGELRVLGVDRGSPEADQLWRGFLVGRREERAEHPERELHRLLEFAIRNRQRLPIVIVDNIDQLERADEAARWVIGLHRNTYALTTIAMEDTTLWRLRREGDDRLQSLHPEQFWLHRPPVREVIESRRNYLRDVLEGELDARHRTRTRLGPHQSFQWSVDSENLIQVVSRVLLEEPDVSQWLGKLCNFDISKILQLCEQIILSPHIRVEDLLKMQMGGAPDTLRWRVLKAIISPRSHQLLEREEDIVSNIFGVWLEQFWVPLLPARVLALLREHETRELTRREDFPGFMTTARLRELLHLHLNVPVRVLDVALERLLNSALIESYVPIEWAIEQEDLRVKITPRGKLHLDWAKSESTYVRMMAEVDLIGDEGLVESLRQAHTSFLDSLREGAPTQDIHQAERAFISLYVQGLIDASRQASPALGHPDVQAITHFEDELVEQWRGKPSSRPR